MLQNTPHGSARAGVCTGLVAHSAAAIALAILTAACRAADLHFASTTSASPMQRKTIATDRAPKAIGPYSQAVVVDSFVFCSGQIALDPSTGQLAGTTIQEQTERVMANVTAVLDAAGCKLSDVVKTTVFLSSMQDFPQMNEVYGRYFASDPPARSTIEAAKLPRGAMVEIEVIARKP